MIDGKKLIEWGFKPSKWFGEALKIAQLLEEGGVSHDKIYELLQKTEPVILQMRDKALSYGNFLYSYNEIERENASKVHEAMDILMRIPTVEVGAIMPDACPAGIIPVGAVVATKNAIHPGFHSTDVCCSMAMTILRDEVDPKTVLDAVEKFVHFGPTLRASRPAEVSEEILKSIKSNRFLNGLEEYAVNHFTTQGDGNHFYFVGRSEMTGQIAIVSHHGSRGLGAQLYKRGLKAAQIHTQRVAENIPKEAAWLDANSLDGIEYWNALQIVRQWTKANHFAVHNLVCKELGNPTNGRIWNAHNFVFRKEDDLYYHAKGATPSYKGFGEDDDFAIIPMNMAEPILITSPGKNNFTMQFAPHGAGRNLSRKQYLRGIDDIVYPPNIDVRFQSGIPDASELPGAYKNASKVVSAIEDFRMAKIVDRITPYGSIMAGQCEYKAAFKRTL
jgi:RNA-splicing ligase RtcB